MGSQSELSCQVEKKKLNTCMLYILIRLLGYIGGRSVKYLKSITIQDYESMSYYQRRDYKILPESVKKKKKGLFFMLKG